MDKLQFNTFATLRFSEVFSSVVETEELSGGAMMIDISLAQNDVDCVKVICRQQQSGQFIVHCYFLKKKKKRILTSFKWGGPWIDFTLKFSDKPGMIFDSLSVVSWSCLRKVIEGEKRTRIR